MFQIVVDSAANIPATVVKEYDIHVLSFVNTIDDKPLVCFDPNLTEAEERAKGHEYYEQMRNGLEPKTGLISSGEFEDYF
ncbi:MAG: DegV family protein, partial [Lachnospiraceae bacterium]|nr:DegV family protein [Lachnospiraceae bacterium]